MGFVLLIHKSRHMIYEILSGDQTNFLGAFGTMYAAVI